MTVRLNDGLGKLHCNRAVRTRLASASYVHRHFSLVTAFAAIFI